MASLHEPDTGTAYYRSTDPVKNIKIRVRLERVTSAGIVPQATSADHDAGGESGMEMRDLSKQGVKDVEEIIVSWQEKIFSEREFELYSNIDNCYNDFEKTYNKRITAMKTSGDQPKNKIFTYVDHDTFTQQDETTDFKTTSPNEKPSILAEKMAHLRRRKIGGARQKRVKDGGFVPKQNLVLNKPSDDVKLQNHLLSAPVQIMHIMGDLSPRERLGTEQDEVILCTLKVDVNGVLSIHPDFNRGRSPYVVETAHMGREVFEYTLEHASKQMSRQEQDKELKMYREVYTRHKDFLQACVGMEFEMPSPGVLKLLVYGEIESAKNFEFDDLYLHFFVDLPKYWSAEGHQQLSWVTQTCVSKVEERDDVMHFSFPFDFELFYRKENEEDEMPRFPTILIEVLSLDSWKRFRTEGYTYLTVPSQPGRFRENLNCWRPLGTSIVSQLRRFFIGGSPELEDPTYTVVPSTFQGTHLSKYGFKTETTGTLTVNLNVIMQSRGFKEKKEKGKSLGVLLDTLGISSVQANISNVLEAFKKARLRMLQARENATKELMKETVTKKDA
ncbi:hypothetical protein CHS0354_017116 [Potamilus streckersoni]|uniref:Meckel syndrome type 1 protein n=1 Tax=Potamilus streckersoni TaxID=2493646 RepID=A0AAE0SCU3_9BIVA|nr:hypothetical protein CHS0354_017116 [Potamilus streckersoni]